MHPRDTEINAQSLARFRQHFPPFSGDHPAAEVIRRLLDENFWLWEECSQLNYSLALANYPDVNIKSSRGKKFHLYDVPVRLEIDDSYEDDEASALDDEREKLWPGGYNNL